MRWANGGNVDVKVGQHVAVSPGVLERFEQIFTNILPAVSSTTRTAGISTPHGNILAAGLAVTACVDSVRPKQDESRRCGRPYAGTVLCAVRSMVAQESPSGGGGCQKLQSSPTKQRQNLLRRGVGLRQSRHAGLREDFRLGQIRGFSRQIRVSNSRFAGRQRVQLRLHQIDDEVELCFACADGGLRPAERCAGVQQSGKGGLRAALIGNIRGAPRSGNGGGVRLALDIVLRTGSSVLGEPNKVARASGCSAANSNLKAFQGAYEPHAFQSGSGGSALFFYGHDVVKSRIVRLLQLRVDCRQSLIERTRVRIIKVDGQSVLHTGGIGRHKRDGLVVAPVRYGAEVENVVARRAGVGLSRPAGVDRRF
jgi:hypothetical protein